VAASFGLYVWWEVLDVTLMMMIGTFLGWPMCVVVFFFSPFAAVVIGLIQLMTKRDDVIPYGPFLCVAALFVIVYWAGIWGRVDFAFQIALPCWGSFCLSGSKSKRGCSAGEGLGNAASSQTATMLHA
jgi:prepilin signal peptidase PulO-like enzyme (type II secretory pathway)